MTPTKPAPMTAEEVRNLLQTAGTQADFGRPGSPVFDDWRDWCNRQDAAIAAALNAWRVPDGYRLVASDIDSPAAIIRGFLNDLPQHWCAPNRKVRRHLDAMWQWLRAQEAAKREGV